MINLLRHLFFLKACYLIKLEYKGTTYYPAKVDKTYLPEGLYIQISEQKEAYTTDWLFDILSSACINSRHEIPELYFGDSYQLESAELKDGIFVITLKNVYEKHKAGFISYAELREGKLDEDPKGPSEGEDSFYEGAHTFDAIQEHIATMIDNGHDFNAPFQWKDSL